MAAVDAAQRAPSWRVRCLLALAAEPDGLTDFELAEKVGSQQTSAGKRRHELVTAGWAEFAWVHRASPSGSKARVWKVTEAGARKAAELRAAG